MQLKCHVIVISLSLNFNIDNQFNDCLDGLIMVDLRETDPKILQRYMDKDGAKMFLNYHDPMESTVSNLVR